MNGGRKAEGCRATSLPPDDARRGADFRGEEESGCPEAGWVFGYGSLIWRPGFAFAERRLARLEGYERRFCVLSTQYRGTETTPGLVLGLARKKGGCVWGVAYRFCRERKAQDLAYLKEREIKYDTYFERHLPVCIEAEKGSCEIHALCYVINRKSAHYAGRLSLEEQAARIGRSVGPAGPNCEYLHRTVEHLRESGVRDRALERLDAMVRALPCTRGAQGRTR